MAFTEIVLQSIEFQGLWKYELISVLGTQNAFGNNSRTKVADWAFLRNLLTLAVLVRIRTLHFPLTEIGENMSPWRDHCYIPWVADRWVTSWRPARCQNNSRGGLPISGPHRCCFWGVVTLLGGWLLVVVFFVWDMVSKGRAGSDINSGLIWVYLGLFACVFA